MPLFINGIGVVSPLGNSLNDLKLTLTDLRSPTTESFSISSISGEIREEILTIEIQGLEKFISRFSLRRLDKFSKSALLSVNLAIENAKSMLSPDQLQPENMNIVFGTAYGPFTNTFGFLDSIIEFGDKCASPTMFASSVHNSLASQVSIAIKITGFAQTITCFHQTLITTLQTAEALLKSSPNSNILLGVGDEWMPVRGYYEASARERASAKSNSGKYNESGAKEIKASEGFLSLILSNCESEGSLIEIKGIELIHATVEDAADYLKDDETILISSQFNADYAKEALSRKLKKNKIYNFEHYSGRIPCGNIFDLAIAALFILDKTIYKGAYTEDLSMERDICSTAESSDTKIVCLNFIAHDIFSIIRLCGRK